MAFEVHSHSFVSGPRSHAGYRKGVWCEIDFQHSHEGGSVPHAHPETGPSYGYRNAKLSKKPHGEQFPYVALSEKESTFEIVVTDSALLSTPDGLIPIGDAPIETVGMPAAQRLMSESRLKCVVRDARKRPA